MDVVKVTSLLLMAGSGLGFSFGVRAWTKMEMWCIKGMHMLKVVASESNLGFRGLLTKLRQGLIGSILTKE